MLSTLIHLFYCRRLRRTFKTEEKLFTNSTKVPIQFDVLYPISAIVWRIIIFTAASYGRHRTAQSSPLSFRK